MVADNPPVEGLKVNFVEDTYSVDTVPEVWSTNVGYLVAFVVVSSVTETVEPVPDAPWTP